MKVHKSTINLNDYEHGYRFVSNNSNYCILFIHGGPGSSSYAMFEQFNPEFLKLADIYFFDQRATGLSFISNYKYTKSNLTLDVIVKDHIEILKYLNVKYKSNVIVMAHSWGTVILSKLLNDYPKLIKKAVLIGASYKQIDSEIQFIDHALLLVKSRKIRSILQNAKETRKFSTNQYLQCRFKICNQLNLGISKKYKINLILYKSLFKSDLTIYQKIKTIRGQNISQKLLIKNMFTYSGYPKQVDCDIYFFHGLSDYVTSCTQATKYFESIDVKSKKFYLFKDSAHSPMIDEKEKFNKIVVKIIQGETNDKDR